MSDSAEVFSAFAHAALPAYGLSPDASLTLLNVSENGTFAIDDPTEGRSVLRVHRTNYHSSQAICSELDWVDALRKDGIVRTPAYLPAADGSTVVTARVDGVGERYAVRFAWVDGVEPDEGRLVADFAELGAITARLHEHAKRWQRPHDFTRFTWDYEHALGSQPLWGRWQDGLGVGPAELAQLGRLDDALKARLAAYGQSPDRFGLIHADMRLANLLVRGDAVSVIDFDDCGLSWFMYDLGSSLSFIEDQPYVPDLIDAWATGYRTVTDLAAHDEAMLTTFVMFRRLLLVAWVGSHADTATGQEMGPQFAQVTCDLAETYLSNPT